VIPTVRAVVRHFLLLAVGAGLGLCGRVQAGASVLVVVGPRGGARLVPRLDGLIVLAQELLGVS
jgi:hypothetical protein